MNGSSDSHDDEEWPTPGPNEPVLSWPEYDHLKEAVHDYLDHEPRDPQWRDIWRALAAIMGEYQRDAFVQAHDLDRPAEKACIARLIDGRDECPHHAVGQDDDPRAPPHKPPAADHSTLWLDDDGSPALYGMHVYPGNIELLEADSKPRNQWFDLCEFASQYGLELSVHGKSWYNLGSTVHIVLYPPERYRS
jgi:hypothetical protein